MAEIVGFNTELLKPRRETLEMVVGDLFPRGGFIEQATFWTGLRPMTPDGTPIVGRTPYKNLWTNTGHGTLGWTMACGSGQLLSDLISGRTPAIPFDDLSAARYQSGFTPRVHNTCTARIIKESSCPVPFWPSWICRR